MLKKWKKKRHELWQRVNDWRKRNEQARAGQRRREKLQREKRQRRNAARRRVNYWENKYNNLPPGTDEVEAHKIKVTLLNRRKEFRELNDDLDDIAAKFDAVQKSIKQRTRRIYHTVRVKIPDLSRKIQKKKKELANKGWSPTGGDIVTFDGKPVVEWLAYRMQVARAAGWKGYLNSGYRTPEYSQQLCYQICGHPSCPGTCAGTSSNHTKKGYPYGAIDVSDYYTFGALMKSLSGKIPGVVAVNRLGAQDPVHFSASGY